MLEQDVETVRRIVLDGLRESGARAYLFGSAARGALRRTSDIDVGVLSTRPLQPGTLAGIREALEESSVLCPVDLVDLSETDDGFRSRVLAEGVPWIE